MTAAADRTDEVRLTGAGLRLADLLRVARGDVRVLADDAVRERLARTRAVVDRLAASDQPIYGLTSALGANVGQAIAPAERAAYQARAIRARSVGVGPMVPVEHVRAMLFARLASLAVGGAGISPAVFDALLAMLNAGIHPVVPDTGSIGVADLPPLSHAMLVLIGEGEVMHDGAIVPGGQALRRAGLAPVELGPKDGLALISSNAFSVGAAALAYRAADAALDALGLATALTFEGFRANLSPLDPRVQAARQAPGQVASAARITALLAGSALWEKGSARRVQDPLSLRCVAQIHGPVLWALDGVRAHVECELNGSGDSPLVLADADAMVSSSNFHIPGLALALEGLGLSLAQAASASVQRCQRLYSPGTSGLPLQLTRHGPAHSGFATIQKTLTALWNEVRHLANPACLDFFPVSETVEDHAPMAPHVAAKTARLADKVLAIAAIELLSAAQAVDLAGAARLGQGAARAHALLRAHVPVLDEDRPLGPDIETVLALLHAGAFADCHDGGLA